MWCLGDYDRCFRKGKKQEVVTDSSTTEKSAVEQNSTFQMAEVSFSSSHSQHALRLRTLSSPVSSASNSRREEPLRSLTNLLPLSSSASQLASLQAPLSESQSTSQASASALTRSHVSTPNKNTGLNSVSRKVQMNENAFQE